MPRKWPLLLGLVLGTAALLIGRYFGHDAVQQWHFAARYTARVGFLLLMLTFTASALARLWPSDWSRALLRDRRWWGLGFAACHTIHLVALVQHARSSGAPIEPVALIGGGAAYVLLYAMVLTSNDPAQWALGRAWRWLHKIGIYYLWFIFLQTYLAHIADPEGRAIGIVFSVVALGGLALRIGAWRSARGSRLRLA